MRWPGKSTEKPLLLMSHHDVVEATGNWSHDPFGGDISDGKLWGRGTLDTKVSLWAMLQTAEELAAEGYIPAHGWRLIRLRMTFWQPLTIKNKKRMDLLVVPLS